MDPALSRWIAAVADVERERMGSADFARERARLLAHMQRRANPRRFVRWFAATAAAAALGMAFLVPTRRQAALDFSVDDAPGRLGDVVAAPARQARVLQFSDGSRVIVQRDTRARVLEVDPAGARIMLERGALEAQVVHTQSARWEVASGPYRIYVIGTRFSVLWDPEREHFALNLLEGTVEVSGPEFESRCRVSAGQSIDVDRRASKVSRPCPRAVEATPPVPPLVETPRPGTLGAVTSALVPRTSEAPKIEPAPARSQSTAAAPLVASWRKLASEGKHEAAWKAVTAVRFEDIQKRAAANDLILLADLARFAREPELAAQALLELRTRFVGSIEARQSAFLLGRIAADQQGDPRQGARWFATYLAEEPRGAFAQEALGRLVDCYARAGARAEARAAAKQYLTRYPDGGYRALAERAVAMTRPAHTEH